jgi:hypothetical protein
MNELADNTEVATLAEALKAAEARNTSFTHHLSFHADIARDLIDAGWFASDKVREIMDASDAHDAPQGTVVRDARGMIFEKTDSDTWDSTRDESGAASDELFYPATTLYEPKGA